MAVLTKLMAAFCNIFTYKVTVLCILDLLSAVSYNPIKLREKTLFYQIKHGGLMYSVRDTLGWVAKEGEFQRKQSINTINKDPTRNLSGVSLKYVFI